MHLFSELIAWVQNNPQQFAAVAAGGFSVLQSVLKPAEGWGKWGVVLSGAYSLLVGLISTFASAHSSDFFGLVGEAFLVSQVFYLTHKLEGRSTSVVTPVETAPVDGTVKANTAP